MGLYRSSISFENGICPHYYLCNYLPVSVGQDILSHSLLKFKRRWRPDLDAWIDCCLELLAESPPHPDTIIVRALHHQEIAASEDQPTALDILGRALARRFHARYMPGLLRKSQPTREIKLFSKERRVTELAGVYYFDNHTLSDSLTNTPGPLLIIDDILTTGTTAKMIIAVLRQQFPGSPLSIFTLAKANYNDQLNRSTPLKGQNYHLEPGTDWQVAEEDAMTYMPEPIETTSASIFYPSDLLPDPDEPIPDPPGLHSFSSAQLKSLIKTDSFYLPGKQQ